MREKIQATNGMMLTNGEIYGRTIYLGQSLKKEDFYEITVEEYKKIIEKEGENEL